MDDLADKQSRFIAVDGLNVHYKREGRGKLLVLLHGSAASLHIFDKVVPLLTSEFEVVRADLPGYGLTGERPDRDYRIETYVGFLKNFASALSLPRFSLAGNSLGGNIGWNFALDFPEQLDRLILMNATGYPEKSLPLGIRLARNPVTRVLMRGGIPRRFVAGNLRKIMGSRTVEVDEALIDRMHALMSRPGNRRAFIDMSNTDQKDRSGQIPNITVPTLVLRGAKIDGQNFARDIPGCQDQVFEGVGHLLPEEIPQETAIAIRSFIKSR
jgi:pimeloyl-ACP methyl ester carboxylesterase